MTILDRIPILPLSLSLFFVFVFIFVGCSGGGVDLPQKLSGDLHKYEEANTHLAFSMAYNNEFVYHDPFMYETSQEMALVQHICGELATGQ